MRNKSHPRGGCGPASLAFKSGAGAVGSEACLRWSLMRTESAVPDASS